MIPLSEPQLRGNAWKYVKDCLDSGWVSSAGQYVERFEKAVAQYLGRAHAVACVNGTAALHMALLAAGLQPGEEVIVPALTFVAPANAVRYAGAYPVFIDADPLFWQMDPHKLGDFCKNECDYQDGTLINRHTRRVVRAIMPVDILGHPVDMEAMMALARAYGLTVIEDNAESLGAQYKNRKAGAVADIACLSFNGNKVVTAGGGGMVVTDDRRLADRVRYLATQAKDDPLEYIHHAIGFNHRLTNMQAALGLAQMEHLEEFVGIKRFIAQRYGDGLKAVPGVTLPAQAPWAKSSFWLYTILIDEQKYGRGSRNLLQYLQSEGIETRPLWHPVHRLKPFADCYAFAVEVADRLYAQALSLPSSVGLSPQAQDQVIWHMNKGRVSP